MSSEFKTTNGMKVKLDPFYCLEQFKKDDDVKSWFLSIEAFNSLGGFLSVISICFLMFTDIDPINTGMTIIIMYVFGFIVSQSYILMFIFNSFYSFIFIVYEILLKFFIPFILLIIVMFITEQYFIFLLYIVIRIALSTLKFLFNIIRSKVFYKKYGVSIWDVEITAIKSLNIYSKKKFSLKDWIQNYSNYQKELYDE